jgi:hypothetical protein
MTRSSSIQQAAWLKIKNNAKRMAAVGKFLKSHPNIKNEVSARTKYE